MAERDVIQGKVRLKKRGRWWYAHYATPAGYERKALKVTSLKAAQVKAKEIDELLQTGQFAALVQHDKHQQDTFQAFVQEIFLKEYPRWTEGTFRSTRTLTKKLLEEFGSLPLTAITADAIESYLARRRGDDDWQPATYNRYLAILKTVFKYAIERGRLRHNPAAPIKTVQVQEKNPRPYSDQEIAKLLEELTATPDKRDIAIVAVDTGMRQGELARLKWEDVDFERKQIVVKETKNKEDRTIPMTNRVHTILAALRQQNQEAQITSLLVWGKPANIRQLLTRAGKRAGIAGCTQHRLRDTFATQLADNEAPLDRMKKLLGHKTVEMTLRYAETREYHLKETIALLNR